VIKLSQNNSFLYFAIGKLIRAIGANPHMDQVHCDATNFVFPYQEFLVFLLDKAQTLKQLTASFYFRGKAAALPKAIGSLRVLE
jgi:hypothetical protein